MMLAVPLAKLGDAVKIPALVKPVPLMALSVPPVTSKSPASPFHQKLVPGFSENAKVIKAVSPDLSCDRSEVIVTVGANVSMLIAGEMPAEPELPAVSW